MSPITFSEHEWDVDTDHAFALGLTVGMFMWTDYAWYWCLAYLAFLVALFALARRYIRPASQRLAAWIRRRTAERSEAQ